MLCIAKLCPGVLCFCCRPVLLLNHFRDDTTQTRLTRLVVAEAFAVLDLRPCRVGGFEASFHTVTLRWCGQDGISDSRL